MAKKKGQTLQSTSRPPRSNGSEKKKKQPKAMKRKGKPRGSTQLRSMLRGCVDPFSTDAVGCKCITDDTHRTMTYTVRGRETMTTNPEGTGAFWFQPGVYGTSSYSNPVSGICTVWTDPAPVPESVSITNFAAKYRVVCAGLHVFAQSSLAESQGIVQITTETYSDDAFGTPQPVRDYNINSQSYPEVVTDSLMGFDKYVTFKRPSHGQYTVYEPLDGISVKAKAGWAGITISVSGGAPAAAVICVEYIYHLELLPDPIGIGSRIADPPSLQPPVLKSAVATAARLVPFVADTSDWQKTVTDIIESPLLWRAGEAMLTLL